VINKLLITAVVGSGFLVWAGKEPDRLTIYTADQAAAGLAAYQSSCINCHTDTLIAAAGAMYMGQQIPPLAGPDFMARWGGRKANDLSLRVKETVGGFPPANLDETTYLSLTAYILAANGGAPGKRELTASTDVVIQAAAIAGNPGSKSH